ncbi:MAG TPA: hypothetical protein VGE76_13890 [Opitutaceae bacterium]
MNATKNTLIAVLALATVGGAVLAWKQYGELVELRASALDRTAREDFQKRIADLEKQNRELQDRLASRSRRGPGGEAGLAGAGDEGEGPGGRGPGGPGGPRGRFGDPRQADAAMRELMAKPEVQALMAQQQKAAVESRYAALFKSLNLSPEQAEKLKTLLADRMNTGRDVAEAARAQGIDPREDRETFAKLLADAQTTLDNSIKSVISDQGYSQLQAYEQTMPQRNLVEQFQRQLAYSETPLTTQQAEQLVQIMAANPPQRTATDPTQSTVAVRGGPDFVFSAGGGPGLGGPAGAIMIGGGPGAGGGSATITSNAIAQSQSVLNASQVAALQQLQQQQAAQQQLQQTIRNTLSGQQSGATGSGASTGGATTAQPRPKG